MPLPNPTHNDCCFGAAEPTKGAAGPVLVGGPKGSFSIQKEKVPEKLFQSINSSVINNLIDLLIIN